jgi:preprotein translocase subunit SecE
LKENLECKERVIKIMADPVQFAKEVKAEGKKVTWPTRRETMVSTIAVFVMVTLIAIFLYVSDQIIAFAVQKIMGF